MYRELIRLAVLYLLTGVIPEELGQLTAATELCLSDNQLSGDPFDTSLARLLYDAHKHGTGGPLSCHESGWLA